MATARSAMRPKSVSPMPFSLSVVVRPSEMCMRDRFYPLALSGRFNRLGKRRRRRFGPYVGKVAPAVLASFIVFTCCLLYTSCAGDPPAQPGGYAAEKGAGRASLRDGKVAVS